MSKSWTSYLTEQAFGYTLLTIVATDALVNNLTGVSILNKEESLGHCYNEMSDAKEVDDLVAEFKDETKTVNVEKDNIDDSEFEFV